MRTIHVTEYNRLQESKWREDWDSKVQEWRISQSTAMPQLAFYIFTNSQTGEYRKTGYVAYGDNKAILRKTKKQAINDYLRSI